ncbi:MAG: ribosomal-processing cysteine protease Prp [Spirochaetaceae bacterium]
MIRIVLRHDDAGCLRELHMDGHATVAPAGENPVCAAATALGRTAARVLDAVPGIRARGHAGQEGTLHVEVESYEQETANYLKGVSDYLLVGTRDLEREYPADVAVVLENVAESERE